MDNKQLFLFIALALVLLLRPVWVFPMRWVRTSVLRREAPAPWTHTAVLSWAGMRGVVTLAAALLLERRDCDPSGICHVIPKQPLTASSVHTG